MLMILATEIQEIQTALPYHDYLFLNSEFDVEARGLVLIFCYFFGNPF
jgi:hypothetical protein